MFGIDSIKLRIQTYGLCPTSDLQLQKAPVDIKTGEAKDILLYNANGLKLEGQKAYKNTDLYNLDLSVNGMFVKFSVPKVVNGNNDIPVDDIMTRKALQTVQEDLQKNDIKIDIDSAKLSRVDLFRQQKTAGNFLDYVPVFQFLRGTRLAKRDYGTSFLFYNSQREICFYDKDQERAIKQGLKHIPTSNNVRAEVRLLSHRPISKTGLDVVSDIFNNYGRLEVIYQEQMKKSVFCDFGADSRSVIVQEDLLSEMKQIKAVCDKFGIKELKQIMLLYGTSAIMEGMTFESLVNTVLEVSDHKNKRDLQRQVSKLIQKNTFSFKKSEGDLKKLYEDLYLKFVA